MSRTMMVRGSWPVVVCPRTIMVSTVASGPESVVAPVVVAGSVPVVVTSIMIAS